MIYKIIKILMVLIFVLSNSALHYAYGFKDATEEVNNAASNFSEEGLFGSFIHQYGNDLYRPDGYVTRGNMILILNEYHVIIKRLMNQNRSLQSKISGMGSRKLSSTDMDMILREFQKMLDPMLQKSPTIVALKKRTVPAAPASSASGTPSSTSSKGTSKSKLMNMIAKLSERIYDLEEKSSSSTGSASGVSDKSVGQSADVAKELKSIKSRLTYMTKDLSKQKKQIAGFSKGGVSQTSSSKSDELIELQGEVAELKKLVRSSKKAAKSPVSGKDSKKVKAKVSAVDNELDGIRDELDIMKSDIAKIERSKGAGSRGVTDRGIVPFWAKISIGFSTLALFFMAR